MEELPNVISVITIVIDPEKGSPRLDLGSVSPVYAYTILKTAADAVYDVIPSPTVVWDNEIIADFEYIVDDDDEDFWD